ncbi:hypothetical protein E2P81_ATG06223 [Venturia nashicola]|uniref:Uncharacterized protein n=1 Tax=Venturia nashicola TaxID=86259 RepID=A0A4Z1NRH3_9PEZI|nr:hypothetical protein E6O75_ATG06367 [Venturia nashicola]TLD27877.1 hypothetical protein E2P81_ATG06223 [Venturia nashicola]
MGITHSTARYLAPASFLFDFAAQQYGIFSKPNMQDIHDRNLAAFSPQPLAIGGFFFPQQFIQLAWLWKLWGARGTGKEVQEMVDYAPYYALGNVCIGTWMFFWNSNKLATSNIFVWINTLSQLYYISTQIAPLNTKSTNSILTHIVAKTFAGIGVLDLLHNTSAAYYVGVPPNTLVKVATGVGFAAMASVSDWIFGGCLVWDLAGLAAGQGILDGKGWGQLLGAYAVGTAAIVGAKNWVK